MSERKSRRIVLLACLLVAVGGVVLSARSWQRHGAHPSVPVATTLEQIPGLASDQTWVTITNATWYCAHPIRPLRSDSGQVVVWNGESRVVVIADFQGNITCSKLTPAQARGTVSRLERESGYSKNLEENGLKLNDAAEAYLLCTYCGPPNELAGVLAGITLSVIGLGLLSWQLRGRQGAIEKR